MSCCWGSGNTPTRPDFQLPPPRQQEQRPTVQLTPPVREISFSRKPLPLGCQRFKYRDLQEATGDFAKNAAIGEGGFGTVYRGTLEDETVVAIKCLDRLGLQGDNEFLVEITLLTKLRHANLVTLFGVCTENQNRITVFEYMPEGSLRDCLDLKPRSQTCTAPRARLLWPARMEIALGAARGLAFLHEGTIPGVIHRDVKSSNILIDRLGQARVSDFGLAIHTGTSSGLAAANYEVKPATDAGLLLGTFGYTSPEYKREGRMSQKSDVYSFGVVLLELLSGRKPIDTDQTSACRDITDALVPVLQAGDVEAIKARLDPVMPVASVPITQLVAFSEVALACLQSRPENRLRMAEVVAELEAIIACKEDAVASPSSCRDLQSVHPASVSLVQPSTPETPFQSPFAHLPTSPCSARPVCLPGRPVLDRDDSAMAASGTLQHPPDLADIFYLAKPGPGAPASDLGPSWPSMPLTPSPSPQAPTFAAAGQHWGGSPVAEEAKDGNKNAATQPWVGFNISCGIFDSSKQLQSSAELPQNLPNNSYWSPPNVIVPKRRPPPPPPVAL